LFQVGSFDSWTSSQCAPGAGTKKLKKDFLVPFVRRAVCCHYRLRVRVDGRIIGARRIVLRGQQEILLSTFRALHIHLRFVVQRFESQIRILTEKNDGVLRHRISLLQETTDPIWLRHSLLNIQGDYQRIDLKQSLIGLSLCS